MRSWKTILACVFAATLLGIFAYGASVDYFLEREFHEKVNDVAYLESQVVANLFVYGVVQSVDSAHSSFTMSFLPSSPSTSTAALSIALSVTGDTDIQQEELQADQNGVYVGLSPLTPGTFSDITPGTRVAVRFQRSGNGFLATDILFGNPL